MKKIKSYNLDEEVIAAINNRATADVRKDSDWLNIYLTKQLLTPVKKAKTELAAVTYPIKLNIEAWDKWIAFRKVAKFKAYKSDATMKKLSEMGNHGEQMLIVQNSIDCEYQGLFALKANNSAATKTSGNLSACEDFING
jgi:hypothetical protein